MDSPFEALTGAIVRKANEIERANSPEFGAFVQKATRVGKAIAGTAAKIGAKVVTFGVIGASEIESVNKMADDISDTLADSAGTAVTDAIISLSKNEESFAALRESLTKLPDILKPDPATDDTLSNTPLIVVIDELDRCRPDFALGMLETLKHFFRVQNIHFVLVTNVSHLCNSVSHRYGHNSQSDEYIEKFYDFLIHFEQI